MKNLLQNKSTCRIPSLATGTTICCLILGATLPAAPSAKPSPQPVSLISKSGCGPLALGQLAEAMKLSTNTVQSLLAAPAPQRGYSMAELLTLAQTNGLALQAVRRPPGADLVLPSVVHWKSGHFSTLLERKGGTYRTVDTLFGSHGWISSEAVASGSSGAFLVPSAKAPDWWAALRDAEAAAFVGGATNGTWTLPDDEGPPPGNDCCDDGDDQDANCDPPSANDGPDDGGGGNPPPPCCCDMGMPSWQISEPYCNQFIIDRPLAYRTSNQKWFPLKLVYKNRGIDHGTNIGGFGPKWECNWLGFVRSEGGALTSFMTGGGVAKFEALVPHYLTARVMILGDGEATISILSPTGAWTTYRTRVPEGAGTNFFMDKRLDKYGRVVKYNPETNGTVLRIKNVVDIDGRTNTIAYTNTSKPHLITSVTDPYGRTAYFKYNTNGWLTNITDTSGMISSFLYATNTFNNDTSITNINTPYGNTAFQHLAASNDNARAVVVTEASGDKQLFAYRSSAPDGPPCASSSRVSFHWNRSQFSAISDQGKTNFLDMPLADYQLAPAKSWLLYSDGQTLSETVDTIAGPYDSVLTNRPGCVSFTYQGQTNSAMVGTLKRVTSVSRDGLLLRAIGRTDLGRPSNVTNFFSDGTFTSYANTFDANGRYLQQQSGPRSESVRGYGYHNSTITNLLTAVTNPAGDWVLYTHDTNTMKVTTVTFSSGLVRSNFYYTSGDSKGFLQTTIDVGIRTNSFSYLYGNLVTWTNELGLVRNYTWDNLNRLVLTSFPDGTTRSNLYDRLDLVGVKDRLNHWSTFTFDSVRQLTNEVSVDGAITTYAYCGCGAPSAISRWLGATALSTQFYYDVAGRLTNTTFADNYQINRAYDGHDLLKTVTDSGGRHLEIEYSQLGLRDVVSNVWLVSDSLGPRLLLANKFDEYGRVTNSVDRNGVAVTNKFDLLGRVLERRAVGPSGTPAAGLESFGYDLRGLAFYTNALGKRDIFVRDTSGRLIYQTNANNEVLQFTYDGADDLLTLTDGKLQTVAWHYDAYSRPTNKLDQAGVEVLRYVYDPEDRLTNCYELFCGRTFPQIGVVGFWGLRPRC